MHTLIVNTIHKSKHHALKQISSIRLEQIKETIIINAIRFILEAQSIVSLTLPNVSWTLHGHGFLVGQLHEGEVGASNHVTTVDTRVWLRSNAIKSPLRPAINNLQLEKPGGLNYCAGRNKT